MGSELDEGETGELACQFFSPYTSLGVAEGGSGFENDGWVMDPPVVWA